MSSELQLPLSDFSTRSNKRLGILCVYCGRRANTKDHVPAKLFLRTPYPANLRTVPACCECNGGHSKDEEYFRVVMGISSFDAKFAIENEEGGYLDRILTRSPALDERITSSLSVDKLGRVYIAPDLERMKRVCAKLACGLFALRYGAGRLLRTFEVSMVQHGSDELPQELIAAMHYVPGLRAKRWTTVQANMVSFLFAKGWLVTDPSIWCMLDLNQTVFAAIRCPSPPMGRAKVPLINKPW